MLPIRVYSPDIVLQTEIDTYTSLQFERKWHGVGTFELVVNKHSRGAEHLQKGSYIVLGADTEKAGIILHRQIQLDERGKASENWSIRGLSIEGITQRRLTYPPSGTAYDRISGSAEAVMKHYIQSQIISPYDSDRHIPRVEIAPNQHRGQDVSWQSRYKILSEELQRMSMLSGLGWYMYIDLSTQELVFDVREGVDRTAGQDVNPRVILSPEFDSIRTQNYMDSDLDYRNVSIVAGQGEGADRRIIEVGNASGLDRLETFVDARDVSEDDEDGEPIPEQDVIAALQQRGQEQLNELATQRLFEAEILQKTPFAYEQDWNLGDVVTVQNTDWGVTMDTRIIAVKETYEPSGFQLEASFGNDWPTLIDKIKQELSGMKIEMTR